VSTLFDLPFEEPEPEPQPEPQPAPSPAAAAVRQVYSVSELTAALRDLIETRFAEVWVEGELSNAKVWTTGHLYFTLKDGGAQLKGIMFRSTLRYLRFKPDDGLHVVVRGRLGVYDLKGEYQIVAEYMEPQGYGRLQLAFEQLKKRLAAEGLFDSSRKRPLPALPRRIGIVTSIDGAALRDIIRVLRRRYPNAHLVIAPTRVQGEDAAGEIVRALRQVARVDGVDVVIVGRGGGSLEDLWAFNEEKVARAMAACPVPVISAVGHETDVTIADFVADLRAPTPSAAAEMVVRRKDEFHAHIAGLGERLQRAIRANIRRLDSRLQTLLARPGYAGVRGRVGMRGRHLVEVSASLHQAMAGVLGRRARRQNQLAQALASFDPRHRLASVRQRLLTMDSRLRAAFTLRRHRCDSRFRSLAARLDGLSPLAVLTRGYAVCWDGTRTAVIRTAATVATGDPVIVTLSEGELECTVQTARPATPAGRAR
jgi:exodeoxyribonuclease VII large subunit